MKLIMMMRELGLCGERISCGNKNGLAGKASPLRIVRVLLRLDYEVHMRVSEDFAYRVAVVDALYHFGDSSRDREHPQGWERVEFLLWNWDSVCYNHLADAGVSESFKRIAYEDAVRCEDVAAFYASFCKNFDLLDDAAAGNYVVYDDCDLAFHVAHDFVAGLDLLPASAASTFMHEGHGQLKEAGVSLSDLGAAHIWGDDDCVRQILRLQVA